jgi:5-enolpyruvylshikimate-3-phosphate synthase
MASCKGTSATVIVGTFEDLFPNEAQQIREKREKREKQHREKQEREKGAKNEVMKHHPDACWALAYLEKVGEYENELNNIQNIVLSESLKLEHLKHQLASMKEEIRKGEGKKSFFCF